MSALIAPFIFGSNDVSKSPVVVTRARLFLLIPPTPLNDHHTTIQLLYCTPIVVTIPLTLGLKTASRPPTLNTHGSRHTEFDTNPIFAKRNLLIAFTLRNAHPIYKFTDAGSTTSANTALPTAASNVGSYEPSGLMIATLFFIVVAPTIVNTHPMIILLSGSIFMVFTQLFTFGLNVVSKSPVVVRRARLFLSVPFTHVKVPPMIIFPDPSIAITLTVHPITFPVNVISLRPVVVTRAIPVVIVEFTPVNIPPISVKPGDWIVIAFTVLFTFPVNVVSKSPVTLTRANLFLVTVFTVVNNHPT